MSLITKQAIANLQTTLSMRYREAWDQTPVWYSNIATDIPSSTRTNTYGWMQRLLQMRQWIGPRQFQNLNTFAYVLENLDFELTVKVPRNDIEDDNLGIWSPLMSEMGRQGRKLPDVLVQQALQAGTTGLGFDGVPFFSISHPVNPAGVQSNLFTSGGSGAQPLLADGVSFQNVRQAMIAYVGEDGLPLGVRPNLLIVPPQLEYKAKQILVASTVVTGGTNIMMGDAKMLVVPELSNDSSSWYLADTTKGILPLIYQIRQAIQLVALTDLQNDNVFFNKEFIWGQDGRAAAGYGPWFLMAKGGT